MHTPIKFYVKIPVDLYRAGTPTKPKFDYIRTSPPRTDDQIYDVKIDPKTQKIDCKTGGLSLFNAPNYSFGNDWWVVKEGTQLPLGYTISKDATNGKFKGHYTIRSMKDIHIEEWKRVLGEWASKNAIHISNISNKQENS